MSAPGRRLAGTKVLIVEDQPDLGVTAGQIVSDPGCDVHTVGDGDRAIEYVDTGGDPGLLFTELVRPGRLDGIGSAREAQGARPNLRIILTFGYTACGPFAEALQGNGDCQYVTKPYSREISRSVGESARAGRDGGRRKGWYRGE